MIGGYHPWFHEELQRRVIADQVDKAVDLGKGTEPDFAAYRYACGFIAGLDHALTLAEDIKKEQDRA